jgi:hypothetical protein
VRTALSPDSPELRAIAQLAGVAPSRLARAYNDPEHILEHFTIEEMKRLQVAYERLLALIAELTKRTLVVAEAIARGGQDG